MPWPLKLISNDEWHSRIRTGCLEIGHCCYSDYFDEEKHQAYDRLSSSYLALPEPRRRPIAIMLPGDNIWFPDVIASNDQPGAKGWAISGTLPNLTVTPSINFVGRYHGYVTGGVVTDDCEGRTFPAPLPQPKEHAMSDPTPSTEPQPSDAPAAAAPPVAVEPKEPFKWSGATPTLQRFVLFVLAPGVLRPAVVVDVHAEDVDLAVMLSGKDHASTAAIMSVANARQDQDGKAPGTWHWSTFQTSSVVTNLSEMAVRVEALEGSVRAAAQNEAAQTFMDAHNKLLDRVKGIEGDITGALKEVFERLAVLESPKPGPLGGENPAIDEVAIADKCVTPPAEPATTTEAAAAAPPATPG